MRLLLTLAAASALTLPPDCGVATWRAGPSLVRVELDRGGKLNALTRSMWEALDAVLEDTDDALLITSGDAKAFSAGADVNAVASESVENRQDFLRLEYETLEKLQERDAPTVAVADGLAFGAGAGVFMACDERVVTERSRLAMPECRIGIVPDAGALRFLTKHCEPAVARYLALTGVPLNAHDLYKTGLATRYVPDKEDLGLDQLYAELSSAPAGELATPLDRRGVEAPRRLESGLFKEATLQAVRDAFEKGTTVDAVRADLETAREAAKKLQGSCGWATREAADGVLDVLDAAADGLQKGCPTALAVTLDAIDRLAARRGDADPAAARYGRRVELAANARLGGAPDFAEGVACVVGARRGERPKWSNDAALVGAIQRVVDGLGDGTSLADVVAGARDFRSPGGMYDTLKPELLTATESERKAMTNDPTTVVSWPLFKQNQFPYLELRRPFILGISDQKWKPTATHIFMRICHDKGILKHVFTQNIDGLDYQTGIPSEKVISVHGSMGQINCEGCGQEMPQLQFNAAVKANIKDLYGIDPDAPKKSTNILCDKCHKPLVKPNTVLYGRSLPSKFFEALKEDFPSGGGFINILFVVGTSLTVHPAASVPQHATASMKVLVNVDEVGQFDFSNGETSRDIFLQGKCDEMFVNLAAECGWLEEMASFDAIMSDSSRLLISEKMKEMENQIKMNNGTAGSSGGSVSGGSGSSGSSSGGSKK